MSEFKFKYWLYQFKDAVKGTFPWIWIMAGFIGLLDIIAIATDGMDVWTFLMSISIFVFIYGIAAILALAVTTSNAEIEYIRYQKGFCLDYFYAYENKFIKGKPVQTGKYIKYAEIYRKLGDYKSAISVLNSINAVGNSDGRYDYGG